MMGLGLIESAMELGGKFIVDEDKKTEFAYKTLDIMLSSKTYRWIDALVKLSYAAEQITKGLLRPLGSVGMFCFAAYCETHAIELSESLQYMMYGAPLAWGASRHVDKKNKTDDEGLY